MLFNYSMLTKTLKSAISTPLTSTHPPVKDTTFTAVAPYLWLSGTIGLYGWSVHQTIKAELSNSDVETAANRLEAMLATSLIP